ncbi:MAG: arginine--tRNA ligase [Ginsengibacter sp.]
MTNIQDGLTESLRLPLQTISNSMTIVDKINEAVSEALSALYDFKASAKDLQVSLTKPEFTGDYTLVLFSLIKKVNTTPDVLGSLLGDFLVKNHETLFNDFNVIKGFLNLSLAPELLTKFAADTYNNISFGQQPSTGKKVMVEYASPNTNKPLHLGHLRNIFIGWSIAEILKADGYNVVKTSIVNDRGIHICKSMLAWERYANGATPETTHTKGDHFVGDYYVKFNEIYNEEIRHLVNDGMPEEKAKKEAPVMKATQEMLLKWEENEPHVKALWQTMNGWVYKGFDETYNRIGADFDKTYYESDTYLLGKDFVYEGLAQGKLFRKDDGSIWIDLTAEGLDEKLLLRSDGTSVYMTSDIGLANSKYKEYQPQKSIYVIGDEQNYHMKVLQQVCKKLGMPYGDKIFHLSYGMVELTTGKMKSREGTVVDADDIVDEVIDTARKHTEELGKTKGFSKDQLIQLYETIGLGAMKFYLLRVDPKKRMIFNPEESIDFHGFTGPFIQYTYARIQSVFRKMGNTANTSYVSDDYSLEQLSPMEKELLVILEQYPNIIHQSAEELNPSVIAVYSFQLAQKFNTFYNSHSIASAETKPEQILRLQIASVTANIIKSAMHLLGINVPDKM